MYELFNRSAGRDARHYNRLLLALILPPLAVMLAYAFTQEPLRGDLTRLGGFSENDYGWNRPQKRFVPPLVDTEYERPYDIVILGDSFSSNPRGDTQTDPGAFWPNYVAQKTGLSVTVLATPHMPVQQLAEHPIFKASPPRLVIVQHVERYLMRNNITMARAYLGHDIGECPNAPPSRPGPIVERFTPLPVAPVPWRRDDAIQFDFGQAVDAIWKAVFRNVAGLNITRAHDLPLVTGEMFSNRRSDRLLVYDDEFRLAAWSRTQIDAALCNLLAAQALVERNGRTAFVFLVAPNKLTVYDDYIADERYRRLSRLELFYRDERLHQIRLLEEMRTAVRRGVRDVYMPNDTHWGTPGHEIAADAVVQYLRSPLIEASH